MGLWSYLRGDDLLEDSNTETRSLKPGPGGPARSRCGAGGDPDNHRWTPLKALAVADVWSCREGVQPTPASSLPIHVYRRTDGGPRAGHVRRVGGAARPSQSPPSTQADLASAR